MQHIDQFYTLRFLQDGIGMVIVFFQTRAGNIYKLTCNENKLYNGS